MTTTPYRDMVRRRLATDLLVALAGVLRVVVIHINTDLLVAPAGVLRVVIHIDRSTRCRDMELQVALAGILGVTRLGMMSTHLHE
jgi:hypothetical protein